ncbi:MAG TPA: hypothetical protein VGX24_04815 [Pyrinomonadaceae bacterium]|jgi:hypothetical protein|nr:hypothetical protein [Pyrinomonadaceae bacterium]
MGIFGHHGNGKERMHLTETPDVRHITNPDVMHEESDVSVRGVGTFVGLLFLGLIIVSALMYGMFNLLDAYATSKEARPAPMARLPEERLPPPGVPRLQGAPDHRSLDDRNLIFEKKEPTLEWDALRAKFKYDLENYHDPDPGTGNMRIPIADAKRRLLEKGLPTRPGAQADAEGINLPTFASAGRQAEKREKWATTGSNAAPAASNPPAAHDGGAGEVKH